MLSLQLGSLTLRQHQHLQTTTATTAMIGSNGTKGTSTSEASTSTTSSSNSPQTDASWNQHLELPKSVQVDLEWEHDDDFRSSSSSSCGQTGQYQYRSIQAPIALPKPTEYTRISHVPPPPVKIACWGRARPNKLRHQHIIFDVKPTATTSCLNWKPFPTSFLLDTEGNVCHSQSLVSYFEVDILPKQDQHIDDDSETNNFDIRDLAMQSLLVEESDMHIFEDALSMDATYTEQEKIKWKNNNPTQEQQDIAIAVGVTTQEFKGHHTMPGWDQHSIAYHGDDGTLFGKCTQQNNYGPTFGYGDTIGCGIDYGQEKIFFTKNATFLGYGELDIGAQGLCKQWKPTIGLDDIANTQTPRIKINLKGPFKFDLKDFMEHHTERCYV